MCTSVGNTKGQSKALRPGWAASLKRHGLRVTE